MSQPIPDTYFFMLDHPAARTIEQFQRIVSYQSPRFSQPIYEADRGERFPDRESAYRDWVEVGRQRGLRYAEGADTLLKIVLKVKDEPALLRRWIEHHAAIAGLTNLLVMDCGSSDPEHWAILESFGPDLMVVRYPGPYDSLHVVGRNRPLFHWLTRNAKYLTILDADEFLVGYDGETLSGAHVATLLRAGEEEVYGPAWLLNQAPPPDVEGRIDWSAPIRFGLSEEALTDGLIAGKSIIRADKLMEIAYLGHNLHLGRVTRRMTPGSFGGFYQLHLTVLAEELRRQRVSKHLRAKGALPATAQTRPEITAQLQGLLASGVSDDSVRFYIDRYFEPSVPPSSGPSFETRLLAGAAAERSTAFSAAVEAFDFTRVWRETLPKM
jgi:hypothetical protein